MPEPITGTYSFDAPARMAQTVADGPRYAPLTLEEVSPEGMEQVKVIRAAFSIPESRPFPDVSLITLRHPGMFKGQMVLGIELAKGVIPARDRELAVLRLAWLARAPFEWSEHVDIGKAFGLTVEEIDRVTEGSSAPGWTAHESAILRGVEELLSDHCMSDATWDTLAQSWDEKQMLEYPMLVGSYLMTALQQNSLKIQPKGGFDYR
ncbi:carboxymuconolactone decarboxylase family protein [Novosphingobium kaempferiae]|uniref:carboxymuconolactone decarboxylase family protein n=1 Tax=Novosphingobium kaempferiae TaxID=2896849 RepID=UPI001E59E560|nr:carboxymuconolactone decarboxylase family protein [Novosphingobium kaempferiae]